MVRRLSWQLTASGPRAMLRHIDVHSLMQGQRSGGVVEQAVVPAGGATLAQESEATPVHTLQVASKDTKTPWFAPERPSFKWWVTLALMLGILTQGLNFGTINVALPSMMTSLQAEIDTIHWVITSFMITRTVVMPTV